MSLRYLFPCPQCGNEFELVSKQAGQQLVCAKCESQTVAPKLGSLRQLETLGQEANLSSNSGSGGLRNLLFVCGLGLAILAGIGGYFLYQYAESKITEFDVNKTMDTFDVWADDQPPSVVAQYYQTMNVSSGLAEWGEQPHVSGNKQGAILMNVAFGLFGLAGLGLLMLIGSFVVSR